jgi:hypothetical protein
MSNSLGSAIGLIFVKFLWFSADCVYNTCQDYLACAGRKLISIHLLQKWQRLF